MIWIIVCEDKEGALSKRLAVIDEHRKYLSSNKLAKFISANGTKGLSSSKGLRLTRDINKYGLDVQDALRVGRFSSFDEAVANKSARKVLNQTGILAANRDALIPQVQNRLLFAQSQNPWIRLMGQFTSWAMAKSTQTNKLLTNTVLTFSDLITNRKTDYKFDLDKFTNINGKTGIYIQYAFVRAKKLIQNSNIDVTNIDLVFSELDETDNMLLRGFLKFEHYFNQALNNNEPHHLADFLYELSNLFNSMYQNENILENKNEIKKFNKLKMTYYFQNYSKVLMKSLGIQPAEKM